MSQILDAWRLDIPSLWRPIRFTGAGSWACFGVFGRGIPVCLDRLSRKFSTQSPPRFRLAHSKLCLVGWLLTKNIRNRTGQRATPRRARAAPGIKSIGRSRKVPFELPVQESLGYTSHVYTVMSPLISACKLLTKFFGSHI